MRRDEKSNPNITVTPNYAADFDVKKKRETLQRIIISKQIFRRIFHLQSCGESRNEKHKRFASDLTDHFSLHANSTDDIMSTGIRRYCWLQKWCRREDVHKMSIRKSHAILSTLRRCAQYGQEEAIVQQRHSMCEPIKSDQRCSIHHDIVSPPSHSASVVRFNNRTNYCPIKTEWTLLL